DVPVRPVRGQNIVSERMRMVLRMPASALRQTTDGQIQIGVSNEEVGFDERTTIGELSRMAARACTVLPILRGASMIRSWGALRPMTPDGLPVYVESAEHRGGFVAACHSGVTLAPMHAGPLAEAMLGAGLGQAFESFHPRRFTGSDVRAAGV
ncbi:MAG: FAD-dependent oxidoreductase, partial [Alphaproteobacteria bacterium]|nr:FAD-dependent oxidoreductase [Alphaproteobacteria bacterium]